VLAIATCAAGQEAPPQNGPQSTPSAPVQKTANLHKNALPTSLPGTQGFQEHVVQGKLTLSLDDAIRLALANNTNIQLEHTQIEFAEFTLIGSKAPFDPLLISSFSDTRSTSPQSSQLGGATTLNSLTQATFLGVQQTVETGGNYEVAYNGEKLSSNSSFNLFNPSIATDVSVTFTQPLLKGAGFAINRAPIVIAQRGLKQSRDAFEQTVNDTVLNVVDNYWNVVQSRENLRVQQESLDEAQKSYDHDKRSLELGALPPLDIYRSESTVASRKVSLIQAEYALKEAEDQFRQAIGADIDPSVQAYELELTEKADPGDAVFTIDIPTALERALNYRPEVDSMRLQLANDDTNVRVARNGKLPNLSVGGSYVTNGLGGPPTPFTTAASQMFGGQDFGYGFNVSLSVPIRNHSAEAALGTALASKRRDLYSERQLRESITLTVKNAVHQLEQAKQSVAAAKIALDLSQKTLQADQRKYELGSETIFFVLEAQTELTTAEQALLQAEVSYQDAVATVDHETGGLLDRFHVQIESMSQ
jgi:outer membrane protein